MQCLDFEIVNVAMIIFYQQEGEEGILCDSRGRGQPGLEGGSGSRQNQLFTGPSPVCRHTNR